MTGRKPMFERKNILVNNRFRQYLLPTILMAMSTSMAIVVDGMIVGNLLGAKHLAAVNLVTPLILCFSTFFAMIGVGGSTIMAYARGARDLKRSSSILSLSVAMLFVVSMLFPLIAVFFLPNVTNLLSSDPKLSVLVESYAQILLIGAPLIIIVSGFTFFIRTDGNPSFASKILIAANALNLLMDIVYIRYFNAGIQGAAYATLTGYLLGALMIAYYLLKVDNQLKFGRIKLNCIYEVYSVISTGITSALAQIFIFMKILAINHIVIDTIGTAGMIAFSVCLSCLSLVSMFISGATQTMMPIIGVMYGEKDWKGIKFAVIPAIKFVLFSALLLIVIFIAFPKQILALYGVTDQEHISVGVEALRYFAPSLIGVGFSFTMMYYNQAINRKALSIAISVIQGLSVIPLAFYLSRIYGSKGIWLSFSIAEILTFFFIYAASLHIRKQNKGKFESIFLFTAKQDQQCLDLTITSCIDDAVKVSQQITDFALKHGVEEKKALLVGLAAEEMALYILSQSPEQQRPIDIVVKVDTNDITLRFRDDGPAFNPTICDSENEQLSNIFLLKKIATNIDYARIIGLNSTIINIQTSPKQG